MICVSSGSPVLSFLFFLQTFHSLCASDEPPQTFGLQPPPSLTFYAPHLNVRSSSGPQNPQLGPLTSGHSVALITAKAPAVHFFGSGALTLHSLVPSLLPISSAVRHHRLTRRKTYKTKRKRSWVKGGGGERRPGCCQEEAAVWRGRRNWIHRSARSVTNRHHQHLFLVVGVLVHTNGAIIWKVANGTHESLYVTHGRRLELCFFYINILMKWKYQRKRLRNAFGTQCFSLFCLLAAYSGASAAHVWRPVEHAKHMLNVFF